MRLAALGARALDALKMLRGTRWVWRWPERSTVVLYDAEGAEALREHLAAWRPVLLHVRGEELNVPVLLASLRAGRWWNRNAYVDEFIRRVGARFVITFIDNNRAFYGLSDRLPGVRTAFVQNGTRSVYGDIFEQLEGFPRDVGRVDLMFVFGDDVGLEYRKYLAGCHVSMGSLKNNDLPRRTSKRPGTIAFISQYRRSDGPTADGRRFSNAEYFRQVDEVVLGWLVDYAHRRGKQLSIISCASFHTSAEQDALERDYYAGLVGAHVELRQVRGRHASYEATDSAEVVVTIESTLGYESAARGNRTAFCSVRLAPWKVRGLRFGWPGDFADTGPYWASVPDPAAFTRVADHLFSTTDEQWRAELAATGFDRVMLFDPGNTILRHALHEELGPPQPAPALASGRAAPFPTQVNS